MKINKDDDDYDYAVDKHPGGGSRRKRISARADLGAGKFRRRRISTQADFGACGSWRRRISAQADLGAGGSRRRRISAELTCWDLSLRSGI